MIDQVVKQLLDEQNRCSFSEYLADRIQNDWLLVFLDEVKAGKHPGIEATPELEVRTREVVVLALAEQLEDAATDLRKWVEGAKDGT